MKTFAKDKLREVLENHKHWIRADCDGWEDMRAVLVGADLTRACLMYANLSGACLDMSNLSGADLRGVDLTRACLGRAKNVPYLPMACPDKGAFIGWKRALIARDNYWISNDRYIPVIVKLCIPADASRSSVPFRRKCRCNKAKVVGVYSISGERITDARAVSICDHTFVYSVGEMVEVDDFCTDKFAECAPGIHFFMNKQEAIEYDAW